MKNTTSSTQRPPFLLRFWMYCKEMFPFWIYIPYVSILYLCMYICSQSISGISPVSMDAYGWAGILSALLFMMQMRAFDDIKDYELDKDLFPWRVVAREKILKQDLNTIALISLVAMVVINVWLAPRTLLVFGLVLLYTLGTFKWFFAEKFHRDRPFFTMLTHQPIPWAINFYLVHTSLAAGETYDPFSLNHWVILGVFTLPITAWEVSRKIRAAGKETHYETFSLLLGTRSAAMIPLFLLLLCGGLACYLGLQLGLSLLFFWIIGGLSLIAAFFYFRFLFFPTEKNLVLTPVSMGFTSLLFVVLLIFSLLRFDFTLF